MKIAMLVLAAFLAGLAAPQRELLAPLDSAVNAMLQAAGAPNRQSTRVVPIESSGGAVDGYAQIVGSEKLVRATRAVLQVSGTYGGWNFNTLIPVRSIDRASGSIAREYGVAVDAIVNGPQ